MHEFNALKFMKILGTWPSTSTMSTAAGALLHDHKRGQSYNAYALVVSILNIHVLQVNSKKRHLCSTVIKGSS
jgi:hypothetical protein